MHIFCVSCMAAFGSQRLAELDGALDELALLLQHTESYDRFVRHMVEVRVTV
jgi:hypothetical protein